MIFRKSFIPLTGIFLLLIFAYLISEGVTVLAEKKYDTTGMNHALLIGINGYQDWPKLSSPVNDVQAIAKILTDKYDFKKENVTLMTDSTSQKPTLINILTVLEGYMNNLSSKDNFLAGARS